MKFVCNFNAFMMVQVKILEVASNKSLDVDSTATIKIGRGFFDVRKHFGGEMVAEIEIVNNVVELIFFLIQSSAMTSVSRNITAKSRWSEMS